MVSISLPTVKDSVTGAEVNLLLGRHGYLRPITSFAIWHLPSILVLTSLYTFLIVHSVHQITQTQIDILIITKPYQIGLLIHNIVCKMKHVVFKGILKQLSNNY